MTLNLGKKTPILKGLSRKRKKRNILKSSFGPRKKKPNFGGKKKGGEGGGWSFLGYGKTLEVWKNKSRKQK
jgi:hypothetical protein